MKDFTRENRLLSLCGLNCGLCTMRLGRHCPGCGGGEGNQGCRIARCSLEHGKVQYCYDCEEYPCEKYAHIDEYDSFITHKRQKADLERAKTKGISAYNAEQEEKIEALQYFLSNFNDGRRKSFFCQAINLLALPEIREIRHMIETNAALGELEEKCAYVAALFQDAAKKNNIDLRLRRK